MLQHPPEAAVDWPYLLASKDNFYTHTRAKSIPDHLADILWQAITEVPKATIVHQELEQVLSQPPTLEEFTATIRSIGKSTTPGATGLTYNMVKGWPTAVIEYAHHCLTLLWHADYTPDWMKWSWLCPKPKDPEVEITLDGLRPLILLEVLRKVWVGITIDRITSAW